MPIPFLSFFEAPIIPPFARHIELAAPSIPPFARHIELAGYICAKCGGTSQGPRCSRVVSNQVCGGTCTVQESLAESDINPAEHDTSSAQGRHNFLRELFGDDFRKLAPLMQSAQGDLQTLIDLMSTKFDVRFQNLDVDLQQEIRSMFKRYQDHHHSSRPEVRRGVD